MNIIGTVWPENLGSDIMVVGGSDENRRGKSDLEWWDNRTYPARLFHGAGRGIFLFKRSHLLKIDDHNTR